MKKLILIILFFAATFANAQDLRAPKKVYFGGGIGFGGFYPKDLNDYVMSEYESIYTDVVNGEMYMFFKVNLSMTYRMNKYIDIVGIGEYAFAPKLIVSSNGTEFFSFSRISPGLLVNFQLIPMGERNSIFIGGGIMYHMMRFKADGIDTDLSANTIAPRVQFGFSFNIRKFNPQVCIGFDFAKAQSEADNQNVDLSYTGGHLGILLNF